MDREDKCQCVGYDSEICEGCDHAKPHMKTNECNDMCYRAMKEVWCESPNGRLRVGSKIGEEMFIGESL